jgi:hypothetical protein
MNMMVIDTVQFVFFAFIFDRFVDSVTNIE